MIDLRRDEIKMKLELPEKQKIPRKTIIIYTTLIIICILAIIVAISVEILGNDIVDNLFGINKITKKSEEDEAKLKAEFEGILDNNIQDTGNYQIEKENDNNQIVYTSYSKEEKNGEYEINVNLPYINIKNEEVNKFNTEIKNTFEEKAEEVIKEQEQKILYIVKYKASIENNILSLIIYSDLKQDTNAQRVIIQTFNYNLDENKMMTLEDTLGAYNLQKDDIQNKINTDIQNEQRKSDELINLGYNVFSRDINSSIYKVENVSEYFIYDNNIYIIFAYGNDRITSEKDIVII